MVTEDTIKAIILVVIPTVAGIITSKWITGSWQSRKEKNEIKRSILGKFEVLYGGMYGLIASFNARIYDICMNYNVDTNATDLTDEQKLSESTIQQGILTQVKEDYNEFQKKFNEKYYSIVILAGELKLYYSIEDLDETLKSLEDYLHAAYLWTMFLVNSKNLKDFLNCYNKCKDNLDNIGQAYYTMEEEIITGKIIVR